MAEQASEEEQALVVARDSVEAKALVEVQALVVAKAEVGEQASEGVKAAVAERALVVAKALEGAKAEVEGWAAVEAKVGVVVKAEEEERVSVEVKEVGNVKDFHAGLGFGNGAGDLTPQISQDLHDVLGRRAIQPPPPNPPSSLLARDVLLAHDMLFADLSTKSPAEAVVPTRSTASPYSKLAAPAVKFQQRVSVSTSSCLGHRPKDLSLDETLNVALESIVEDLCRAAP